MMPVTMSLSPHEIRDILPAEAMVRVDALPFPKVASGKVRELFDTGDALLMVATDRLSAFDVILPDGIPGKGILLTQKSLYWFRETADLVPNHLVEDHDTRLNALLHAHPDLIPRSMLVQKLDPLPIEAVVRGYLAGSAWYSYRRTGTLFGQRMPPGLVESSPLPRPAFTPTTKVATGHDEPISLEQCAELLGAECARRVENLSRTLFERGSERAQRAGLLLADTKFEFGTDRDGELVLIDEVLTPDSSRFWPAEDYQPGRPQHAFDKQFVRDYLESIEWEKSPPGPNLPESVITQTRDRYLEAYQKLTRS